MGTQRYMGSHSKTLNRNSNHSTNMILTTTVLCLLPLSLPSPIEILSYTADDSSQSHSHTMEGIPGKEVSGNFHFETPDTENVFHLSYTADDQGFQAVGDHLPVSVKVPEVELPVIVDYTEEVAAARENFLKTQEEVKSWSTAEVTERRRREAEADPVVIPASNGAVLYPSVAASSLPAPGFYPLGSSQPVSPVYHPVYRGYPTHYIPTQTIVTGQAPIVQRHLYLPYPSLGLIPQKQSPVESTIQEGEEEPAALSL